MQYEGHAQGSMSRGPADRIQMKARDALHRGLGIRSAACKAAEMILAATERTGGRYVLGLLAGAAGTLAVTGADIIELAILGRRPTYAPALLVQRLSSRAHGASPSRTAAKFGVALRWVYGPVLGLLSERLYPNDGGVVSRGLVIGGSVLAFELLAMPLVGATPPWMLWPWSDRALLPLHTLAFGMGSALARELGLHLAKAARDGGAS